MPSFITTDGRTGKLPGKAEKSGKTGLPDIAVVRPRSVIIWLDRTTHASNPAHFLLRRLPEGGNLCFQSSLLFLKAWILDRVEDDEGEKL